jgi:hypothetical protein
VQSARFFRFRLFDSTIGNRRGGGARSALEAKISQSGTKTRSSGTLLAEEPDSWGVIRLDFDVID